MSNENSPQVNESQEVTEEVKSLPVFVNLKNDVKTMLDSSKDEIRQRIVLKLAEEEIAKRTEMVIKGLDARKTAEREVAKSNKPDTAQFDENGKLVSSSFSKSGYEALRTAREKLARIDKALSNAIENANYDDLAKIVSTGQPKDKKDAAQQEPEPT